MLLSIFGTGIDSGGKVTLFTDTQIVFERNELTVLKALRLCSNQAYKMARKTPKDMD